MKRRMVGLTVAVMIATGALPSGIATAGSARFRSHRGASR